VVHWKKRTQGSSSSVAEVSPLFSGPCHTIVLLQSCYTVFGNISVVLAFEFDLKHIIFALLANYSIIRFIYHNQIILISEISCCSSI